jgi:hypothetical protein
MRQDTPRPGRVPRWRADLRQRRHHRAFRIAEPRWDDVTRFREKADELNAALARMTEAARLVEEKDGGTELVKVATNLWLARKRFLRTGDLSVPEDRQINRYLEATEKALAETGVTIESHDGMEYDSGYGLEAVAFVPDPKVRVETVQETVRPSIYLHGKAIQMASVIVGCPADAEHDTPTEDENA